MQRAYTQAFLELLRSGTSIDTALGGLQRALKAKHHEKLYGAILAEALRLLTAEKGVQVAVVKKAPQLEADVARKIADVLKGLGAATDTEVREEIDATLIGGFVATFNYQEHDQSYKRVLKSLYESITI